MLTVVAALVGTGVGAAGLWAWLRTTSMSRLRLAEDQRRSILADADREAETTRREAQIEAREQAVALRAELEAEIQDSRRQMAKIEERTHQREAEL
jgi:ribonuclease Y